MDLEEVVSRVGLWWPAAQEDRLRQAATAWERASVALDDAVELGDSAARQARAHWDGPAADHFDQAWRTHQKAFGDDAAGCLAVSRALLDYADAVGRAKNQVEELAVTAGATIVAGIGLAWLTFGTSAMVAGEVTAGLVAAATAVGVELSSTVAAIGATALVGALFGSAEAAVVDMAVTQPVRVWGFHDGGFSGPELSNTIAQGGAFGGVLGGASGAAAVRPLARIEAGELGGVRAPGGTIRAALDPTNWGEQGARFRVGVHEGPGATFLPHERPGAEWLADRGKSVHAKWKVLADDVKNPDALVRHGRDDPGTYTELKAPTAATSMAVQRSISDGEKQLRPWSGGDVLVDGRGVGLTRETAEAGLERAIGSAVSRRQATAEQCRHHPARQHFGALLELGTVGMSTSDQIFFDPGLRSLSDVACVVADVLPAERLGPPDRPTVVFRPPGFPHASLVGSVEENDYVSENPTTPEERSVFDPMPLLLRLNIRPAHAYESQQRAARALFDRLTGAGLGWPLVLVHEFELLVSTYDIQRGVRTFPPGTRSDGTDEHLWR